MLWTPGFPAVTFRSMSVSALMSRLHSLTSAWNERSVSHTLIGQCHLCCPCFVETDKVVVHNLGWSHPGGFPAVTKRVALSLLVLAEVDSGGRTEESRSQRRRCWKCKGASCAVNVAPPLPLGGSRAVGWWGGVAHHPDPLHPLFLACYPQTGPAIPSQVQRQNRAPQPCPSRRCISARPPGAHCSRRGTFVLPASCLWKNMGCKRRKELQGNPGGYWLTRYT